MAQTAGSAGKGESAEDRGKLGLFRLVTAVITLIIGAGVFTLSGEQAVGGGSGVSEA